MQAHLRRKKEMRIMKGERNWGSGANVVGPEQQPGTLAEGRKPPA